MFWGTVFLRIQNKISVGWGPPDVTGRTSSQRRPKWDIHFLRLLGSIWLSELCCLWKEYYGSYPPSDEFSFCTAIDLYNIWQLCTKLNKRTWAFYVQLVWYTSPMDEKCFRTRFPMNVWWLQARGSLLPAVLWAAWLYKANQESLALWYCYA